VNVTVPPHTTAGRREAATRAFACGLALAVLATAAFAPPAAAAGETTVRLVPDTERVAVDGTTTVAVVVTEAVGGVGAVNATVTVAAGDSAAVTDAAVAGGAGLSDVAVAPDGGSARVVAAIMDTADRGRVTVATVTVAGRADGTASLSIRIDELADESGTTYRVGAAEGTTLVVGDGPATPASATPTGTDAAGATTAAAATPTPAPAPEAGTAGTERSGRAVRTAAGGPPALVGAVGSGLGPLALPIALLAALGLGVALGRRYRD
jgi:hypothetical protein